jgi:peptide deformylase
VMRGLNRDGKPQEVEGDELLGRVLQHEFDHLEGRLLIERLTDEERKVFRRTMREKLIDS